MSQTIQFVVDVEVEDDEVDLSDVELLDVKLDLENEETEYSWAARRTDQ